MAGEDWKPSTWLLPLTRTGETTWSKAISEAQKACYITKADKQKLCSLRTAHKIGGQPLRDQCLALDRLLPVLEHFDPDLRVQVWMSLETLGNEKRKYERLASEKKSATSSTEVPKADQREPHLTREAEERAMAAEESLVWAVLLAEEVDLQNSQTKKRQNPSEPADSRAKILKTFADSVDHLPAGSSSQMTTGPLRVKHEIDTAQADVWRPEGEEVPEVKILGLKIEIAGEKGYLTPGGLMDLLSLEGLRSSIQKNAPEIVEAFRKSKMSSGSKKM